MTIIPESIDVRRTINGCGIYTDLGGSRLSPGVLAAMEEINRDFVQLGPLLASTGRWLADTFDAGAARVTPGAAAAIMLGTAACIAGTDGDRSEQLPDTSGMKGTVLIQRGHRYKYDRQVSMTGAKLVEVGSEQGTILEHMMDAMTNDVAMITHPAHLDGAPGTVPLEAVAEAARERDIPVFVDAAYMVYPTELIGSYTRRGADLVSISAKYFGGPNSGGFLMGRADLIDAVNNVHFTAYESGTVLKYGRPLKMDRHIIIATICALKEWLDMDHDARHRHYIEQVDSLSRMLAGIEGLTLEPKCFTMDERFVDSPVNALLITVDEEVTGQSASGLADTLFDGDPCIAVIQEGDAIAVVMDVLTDDEVDIIGQRIRRILDS